MEDTEQLLETAIIKIDYNGGGVEAAALALIAIAQELKRANDEKLGNKFIIKEAIDSAAIYVSAAFGTEDDEDEEALFDQLVAARSLID